MQAQIRSEHKGQVTAHSQNMRHFALRAFRTEKARRRIVNLVLIIYWLLIFEGALRKWIFPQLQQILFFIRDPFVILVYWTMIKSRLYPKSNILKGFIGLAVLSIFLIPYYVIFYDLSFFVPIYGWRNYYFYAPLAFLIGQCFQRDDLQRLIKQNLLIAMPMSLLSFIQFSSPPMSFINKGLGDVGERVFMVTGEIVRTYGTFTFTSGQTFYVTSVLAMVIYTWLMPKDRRPVSKTLLIVASLSSISMVLLSGSRSALILSGLNIIVALLSSIVHSRKKLSSVSFIVGFSIAIIVLFTTVFEKSFMAIKARQESTGSFKSSIIDRIASGFVDFIEVIPDAPLFGNGLGFGTGGGSTVATGRAQFNLAEGEWQRIILEIGPVLALAYIGLRCFLALDLARGAFRSARYQQNPLGILLFAFIAPTLVNGPMTMQGTTNGYVWLFCGFTLAATRPFHKFGR